MVAKKFRIGEVDWCAGLTQLVVHEEKNLAKRVGSTLCGPNFFLSEYNNLRRMAAIKIEG